MADQSQWTALCGCLMKPGILHGHMTPCDSHARAEAMQTALREDLEDAEVSLQETGEEARWALKQIIKRAQAALDGSAS